MQWHSAMKRTPLLLLLLPLGCDHLKKKPTGQMVAGTEAPLTESKAFRDTVSEVAWVEGMRGMRVRGYGLVVGLGKRGSSECPPEIRRRLLQDMYKMERFSAVGKDALPVTPEQIIDDLDTAVVIVEGEIPPAAAAGAHFDLTVRALPGTQTSSIEGGRLYDCDLRIQRELTTGSIEGQILAVGAGPVFVNPWAKDESSPTRADPRVGEILGGGTVKEARRVRLVLEHPSYRTAVSIGDAINTRFPNRVKIADAQSPGFVKLSIPPEYADTPGHFLDVVRHLYIRTTPGFLDRRAAELTEEFAKADAPHTDIVLALEGIGRPVVPLLQKLYGDPRINVSFYAGLTGLALEDRGAVGPVAACAQNARSPHRVAAVQGLARAKRLYQASAALRELLKDSDPRIRVQAYEGLMERGDDLVVSARLGGDNLSLDVVQVPGPNLIYAKRTHERRIALIGEEIACLPPLFFADQEGLITISAEQDADRLTLLRKTQFSDRVSPPIRASFNVAELVHMLSDVPKIEDGQLVSGLNVPYSLVVKALADLCRSKAVNADFVLEQMTVAEIFGPVRPVGRAESDL
jgi:flagellar basal body P-ring protein FlgI